MDARSDHVVMMSGGTDDLLLLVAICRAEIEHGQFDREHQRVSSGEGKDEEDRPRHQVRQTGVRAVSRDNVCVCV